MKSTKFEKSFLTPSMFRQTVLSNSAILNVEGRWVAEVGKHVSLDRVGECYKFKRGVVHAKCLI